MMTLEQAIQHGKKQLKLFGCSEYAEFIEMAIDAIELQIAKKPIENVHTDRWGHDVYEYYCPNCEEKLVWQFKAGYCDECGQAIDWKE